MSDTRDPKELNEQNSAPADEEVLFERIMRSADKRPDLPKSMREQWEQQFTTELSEVVARRKQRRNLTMLTAAASVMIIGLMFVFGVDQPGSPAQIAQLEYSAGTVSVNTSPVQGVDVLIEGDLLETGENAYASIAYQGADLRLDENTQIRLQGDRVLLLEGSLYADTGEAGAPSGDHKPVVIETSMGSISHLGTQFMVALSGDELRAAVREGTIELLTNEGDDYRYSARDGQAEFMRYEPGTEPRISLVSPFDGIWGWVADTSGGYQGDGGNLHNFLVWASRETGRGLVYLGEAREHAVRTALVGDVSGRRPLEALELVDSISLLSIELEGPEIRVSLDQDIEE